MEADNETEEKEGDVELFEFGGGEEKLKKSLVYLTPEEIEWIKSSNEDAQYSPRTPSAPSPTTSSRRSLIRSSTDIHKQIQEKGELPTFINILFSAVSDLSRGDTTTLKHYYKALAMKFDFLIKVSLGLWDDATLKSFHVFENAEKWDENPLDDEEYHEEVLAITGTAHTLIWQFFPLTIFVSKFAEAANQFPIWVFSKDERVRLTPFVVVDSETEGLSLTGKMKAYAQLVYLNYAYCRLANFLYEMTKFFFTCLIVFAPSSTVFIVLIFIIVPKITVEGLKGVKKLRYKPKALLKLKKMILEVSQEHAHFSIQDLENAQFRREDQESDEEESEDEYSDEESGKEEDARGEEEKKELDFPYFSNPMFRK
jgi:hypothetical protein